MIGSAKILMVNPNSSGYVAGGWTGAPIDVTMKVVSSTDTTAALATANLSQARWRLAGCSNGSTKGYFAGGSSSLDTNVKTGDILTYSSGVTAAATTVDLATAKNLFGGLSDRSTLGYFAGGYTGAIVKSTEKVTFSTDTTSASAISNLSVERAYVSGLSGNTTKGYFGGGDTGTSNDQVATTDKITFATSVTDAATTANLSPAKNNYACASDGTTKGYFAGGYSQTNVVLATIDKVVYSTDVTAIATTANLSSARNALSGFSAGQSKGYFIGGSDVGGQLTTADKIAFASDTVAAVPSADLSTGTAASAGISEIGY